MFNKYVHETSQFEVEYILSSIDLSVHTVQGQSHLLISGLNHTLATNDRQETERRYILHLLMQNKEEKKDTMNKSGFEIKGKENN